MKSLFLYLIILLFSSQIYGQDSSRYAIPRHQFSFDFGCHYNYINSSNNGFAFDSVNLQRYSQIQWATAAHPYLGYKVLPTISFHSGFEYKFSYRNWRFNLGLLYFVRKQTYQSDSATLAAMNNYSLSHSNFHWLSSNDNVLKNDFTSKNFEAPVFIGYKWKRFEMDIGVHFILYTFQKQSLKYIDGSQQTFTGQGGGILGGENNYKILSNDYTGIMFQLSYQARINKIEIIPYISIDFDNNIFEAGIQIPFIKLK